MAKTSETKKDEKILKAPEQAEEQIPEEAAQTAEEPKAAETSPAAEESKESAENIEEIVSEVLEPEGDECGEEEQET